MGVGDITYIPLAGGVYGYLAVWMDLYSRKIIGWHLDDNMKEELIITAFKKALMNRSITKELIVHSVTGVVSMPEANSESSCIQNRKCCRA